MNLYEPFYDSEVTPNNKKYSVYVLNNNKRKLIHFGDRNMEQYYDKIGLWSNLNHLDKQRRKSYRARSSGIKNRFGQLTYKDQNSANYWSYNYLW